MSAKRQIWQLRNDGGNQTRRILVGARERLEATVIARRGRSDGERSSKTGEADSVVNRRLRLIGQPSEACGDLSRRRLSCAEQAILSLTLVLTSAAGARARRAPDGGCSPPARKGVMSGDRL